jgi:hypothetical protein
MTDSTNAITTIIQINKATSERNTTLEEQLLTVASDFNPF